MTSLRWVTQLAGEGLNVIGLALLLFTRSGFNYKTAIGEKQVSKAAFFYGAVGAAVSKSLQVALVGG
jgi:hypothetical protein